MTNKRLNDLCVKIAEHYLIMIMMNIILRMASLTQTFTRYNCNNVIKLDLQDQQLTMNASQRGEGTHPRNEFDEKFEGIWNIHYKATIQKTRGGITKDTLSISSIEMKKSNKVSHNDTEMQHKFMTFYENIKSCLKTMFEQKLLHPESVSGEMNGILITNTSLTKNGFVLRATHCYDKREWFDWAVCNFEGEGDFPVKIFMLIDMQSTIEINKWMPRIGMTGDEVPLENEPNLAFIVSTTGKGKQLNYTSKLGRQYKFTGTECYLVSTKSIHDVALVINVSQERVLHIFGESTLQSLFVPLETNETIYNSI
jgi:hypothetical protein